MICLLCLLNMGEICHMVMLIYSCIFRKLRLFARGCGKWKKKLRNWNNYKLKWTSRWIWAARLAEVINLSFFISETNFGCPASALNLSLEEKLEVDSRSIYVGNVDYAATAEELEQHFNGCGAINRVTILCNRFDGHPKGFAYIEFSDKESVQTAMALDESLFRGRQIKARINLRKLRKKIILGLGESKTNKQTWDLDDDSVPSGAWTWTRNDSPLFRRWFPRSPPRKVSY